MKFKVGDKVVVSPKANPLLGGLSGIVVETQESPIADTAYYKVDLDEKRVFPEHHLIAETEYRFLTGLNATAHQILATCGIKAADSDTKVLRAKDGTIIGEFGTGGTLPTNEWFKLVFKNGSSIEVMPNEDAIRSKEEKKMPTKFTFYTVEGYRMDKSNNTKIPTVTTEVVYKDKDSCATGGSATCDKVDYSERDGILNAIANAVLGGNFDREYEKFLADKKRKYDESCKCKICGRNYYEDEKTGKRTPFTPEDARKHEEWHEQNKKNKREKYLIRKEAKRRLAEAEREGKIEQTMKELYKK